MGQDQFALPKLPASNRNHHQHFGIAADQLTRKKLQVLLHLITADLKTRGTKTPHVFLPFRSRVDDSKLEQFLQSVFPGGKLIDMSKTSLVKLLLKSFDEFTLICGLKYLWCRLPNNEVVGWNVYLEFKRRERDAGYPKDAFLTLMPKCLSSSSHASIVYDFLDLMIGIATNSQYNHLSGRKIAKMASVWAFNSTPHSSSAFYDATATRENSFMDGLSTWELTCNGLFHLLLAFLRAMLPDTESDTLKLPKTLQSLLVTNSYPPPDKLPSMKSVITIPCVQIRSTKRCADPYELISKVRQNLRFDKKDKFISIENYTILKNIFQKDSTNEIVSTLTEESRRVLSRLTATPIHSDYGIYPGWANMSAPQDPNIPMYTEVTISNVSLQDYYIWTWLSSLGSDQSDALKSLFGRSIVVEAGLRGFQKWLILSEVTMSEDDYLTNFKDFEHSPRLMARSPIPQEKSLPPPPSSAERAGHTLPKSSLLPDVSFKDDQFSVDGLSESSLGYQKYMASLDEERSIANEATKKIQAQKPKFAQRPRPPPLDDDHANEVDLQNLQILEPVIPRRSPERYTEQEHPEFQTYRAYAQKDPEVYHSRERLEIQEPFETYKTPFDQPDGRVDTEPYDDYYIPGQSRNLATNRDHSPNRYPANSQNYQQPQENLHTSQSPHEQQYLERPGHETQYVSQPPREEKFSLNDVYGYDNDYDVQNRSHHDVHEANYVKNPYTASNGTNRNTTQGQSEFAFVNPEHADEPSQARTSNLGHHKNEALPPHLSKSEAEFQTENHPHYQLEDQFVQPEIQLEYRPEFGSGEVEEKKKKKKKKRSKKPVDYFPMEGIPNGPPPPLPSMDEIPNGPPPPLPPMNNNGHPPPVPSKTDTSIPGESQYSSDQQIAQQSQDLSYNGYSANNVDARYNEYQSMRPPQAQLSSHLSPQVQPRIASGSALPNKMHLNPNMFGAHQDSSDPLLVSSYYHTPTGNSPTNSQYYTPTGNQSQVPMTKSPTPAIGLAQPIPPTQQLQPQSDSQFTVGLPNRHAQQRPMAHSQDQHHQMMSHSTTHAISAPTAHTQHQVPTQHMNHQQSGGQQNQAIPHHHTPPQVPAAQISQYPVHHAPYGQPPNHQQGQIPPGQIPPGQMPVQASQGQMPPGPIQGQQPYQVAPGAPAPQYYYPPPPQGYYPPPQGYGYPVYYPPPQGYYPPPQQKAKPRPTASDLAMRGMPPSGKFNKNTKTNKASMRAALQGGEFGI